MWEKQVRCIVGKELDDICTSCPYRCCKTAQTTARCHRGIYTVVKKRTTGILFFSVPAVYPHSQYIFLPKATTPVHSRWHSLPGTWCHPSGLNAFPGYHSDYALNPFRRWTVLLLFPQLMKTPRLRKILPTTLRPEAIPDKRKRPETQDSHPFLKNVQECPRNICGLPRGFHRNRRLPVPEKSRCAPCIRIKSTVKLYGSAPVTCWNPDQRLRGRLSTQYSLNGPA